MFTRFAVLAALALFGSASAFVPAPAAARSSALAMSSVPDSAKTVEMMQALVKKGLAEINNISEVRAREPRRRARGPTLRRPGGARPLRSKERRPDRGGRLRRASPAGAAFAAIGPVETPCGGSR